MRTGVTHRLEYSNRSASGILYREFSDEEDARYWANELYKDPGITEVVWYEIEARVKARKTKTASAR